MKARIINGIITAIPLLGIVGASVAAERAISELIDMLSKQLDRKDDEK